MPVLYGADCANNIRYNYFKGSVLNIDLHFHDACEIYYLLSGDINYFVEKRVYPIKYGDLMITNNHEVHKPTFQSNKTYERIYLLFDPIVAQSLSTPDFNLLNCFMDRPIGEQNRISLDKNQNDEILKLFHKIDYADKSPDNGGNILKLSYFAELLVFINRAFKNIKSFDKHPNVPEKLIPILNYIDDNLERDLSLELLEHKFFISRFHLSRLFKINTGISIHEYIILKRITKAKKLLSDGSNATDACILSGFNDYSNFIRIFKHIVGITPGQYKKSILKL